MHLLQYTSEIVCNGLIHFIHGLWASNEYPAFLSQLDSHITGIGKAFQRLKDVPLHHRLVSAQKHLTE